MERLNRSWYPRYPACDRPEDDRVAGFRKLGRVPLSAEELQPFWASVRSFIMDGDPDRWRRADESRRKLGLAPRFGDREQQLRTILGESALHVFRFDPPIDVDNDGTPDSVVVWRDGDCAYFGEEPLPRSSRSIPIVLNAAGDGPDVERTRLLFGHPSGGYRLPSGEMSGGLRPLGITMGIFHFDNRYHLDTFFDGWGDFEGKRRNDPEIANRLGVFLRKGGKTTQVCEYWIEDFIDVANGTMREQLEAWQRRKRSRQ